MKDLKSGRFAYAVDLGSTVIDISLIDISGKKAVADVSFKNRQSLYGSDVINRILAATRDPSKQSLMKQMVVTDLRDNIRQLNAANGINESDIKTICICGNTTMTGILLGHKLDGLGKAPFHIDAEKTIICDSSVLFDDGFLEGTRLIISGTQGAFIGGDILSGLMVIDNEFIDNNINSYLLLDLGTNGEMVFRTADGYVATSAACGPAFEGCTRKQHVYGSNTLDAIALGIKTKNIYKNGSLKEPFDKKGLNVSNVFLDSNILRDILLAKAAIRTCIDYLLDNSNQMPDCVYLAGGFGFYMNIDTAIYLGLFPKEFEGKIKVIGNSSLMGAGKICCDEAYIDKLDYYINMDKFKVLQLANMPDYQERLISNMTF